MVLILLLKIVQVSMQLHHIEAVHQEEAGSILDFDQTT